jgi:nucleotide-binding universal stress UspA family protein
MQVAYGGGSDEGMVVLGRRGRGRLTGLLLGSVSQKIVSLARAS